MFFQRAFLTHLSDFKVFLERNMMFVFIIFSMYCSRQSGHFFYHMTYRGDIRDRGANVIHNMWSNGHS